MLRLFYITVIAAFGLGYLLSDKDAGFLQPAILALAIVAEVLGYYSRRVVTGTLIGVVASFSGATGIMLKSWPHEEHWAVAIGVIGCLGGLLCAVVGAIAGYAGERRKGHHRKPSSV